MTTVTGPKASSAACAGPWWPKGSRQAGTSRSRCSMATSPPVIRPCTTRKAVAAPARHGGGREGGGGGGAGRGPNLQCRAKPQRSPPPRPLDGGGDPAGGGGEGHHFPPGRKRPRPPPRGGEGRAQRRPQEGARR